MSAKKFFKKLCSRFLLLNLLAMAVVVVLLCLGVGYGLDLYTHHGEGIVVPDLNIVVSDSGYNKAMPADCILAQTPGHGQKVKEGHTIYVTVNSPSSPTFAIPDIVDNSSLREAEAKLTAMGFRLQPAQRVTGEKDWVYGILCRGRRISNGDRVPIDYPLTLMVGSGAFDDSVDVNYVDYVNPSADGMDRIDVDEFEEVTLPSAGD